MTNDEIARTLAKAHKDALDAAILAARQDERDKTIEECAKVADDEAAQSEAQIKENDAYAARSGFSSKSANDRCLSNIYTARQIGVRLRALKG